MSASLKDIGRMFNFLSAAGSVRRNGCMNAGLECLAASGSSHAADWRSPVTTNPSALYLLVKGRNRYRQFGRGGN